MSQKIIQKILMDKPDSKPASTSTAYPMRSLKIVLKPAGNTGKEFIELDHPSRQIIGEIYPDTSHEERSQLVRAVNSFDDLVRSLKAYGQRSDGFCSCLQDDPTVPNGEHSTQCQMARAALAKAGVKS